MSIFTFDLLSNILLGGGEQFRTWVLPPPPPRRPRQSQKKMCRENFSCSKNRIKYPKNLRQSKQARVWLEISKIGTNSLSKWKGWV